mmetsp:Transcript_38149/g.76323  ORF Transcript_38149/g.76323 Transcript_38149/m.76323 type:complete len:209 (-) Transcript_38149:420-1046(-)
MPVAERNPCVVERNFGASCALLGEGEHALGGGAVGPGALAPLPHQAALRLALQHLADDGAVEEHHVCAGLGAELDLTLRERHGLGRHREALEDLFGRAVELDVEGDLARGAAGARGGFLCFHSLHLHWCGLGCLRGGSLGSSPPSSHLCLCHLLYLLENGHYLFLQLFLAMFLGKLICRIVLFRVFVLFHLDLKRIDVFNRVDARHHI